LATELIPLEHSVTPRVLIVDDEVSVRKVMAAVLAQLGLPCETAASGDEALRILETHQIDAVISDLQMPGMSGMELLAKVKQIYPRIVFLVVTGVDDIRVGIQAMRQGADDYLVKPLQVDANIVLASLTRALHVKRLEQEVENYRHHLEEIVAEQTQQLRDALRQIERSYDHTLEVLGAAIDFAGQSDGRTLPARISLLHRDCQSHGRPGKPHEKYRHGSVAARHRQAGDTGCHSPQTGVSYR
jgi:response regulator RpfG family c-di-GMP phosphodiesterase